MSLARPGSQSLANLVHVWVADQTCVCGDWAKSPSPRPPSLPLWRRIAEGITALPKMSRAPQEEEEILIKPGAFANDFLCVPAGPEGCDWRWVTWFQQSMVS